MASLNAQVIELKHARNHEEPKYIALENLNFAWLEEEIVMVIQSEIVWKMKQVNDIGAVIYPGQVVRVPK